MSDRGAIIYHNYMREIYERKKFHEDLMNAKSFHDHGRRCTVRKRDDRGGAHKGPLELQFYFLIEHNKCYLAM